MQLRSLTTLAPVVALLALFVGLSSTAMKGIDVTRPELVTLPGGHAYLGSLDAGLSGDAPPLTGALAALATLGAAPAVDGHAEADAARAAAANGDPEAPKNYGRAWFAAIDGTASRAALLERARLVVILLGALAGLFVFLITRHLFGVAAGLLALALFSVSPEFLGRAHLVAPEMPLTAFWLMSLYFLLRFGGSARRRDLILAGVGLGLAMATHQAALFHLPVFVAIAALGRMRPTESAGPEPGRVRGPLAAAGILAAVALAVLALLLTGHLGSYFAGVDDIFAPDDSAGRVFLTGAYAEGGFLKYFLVVAAAKTPLATLMLILAGAVAVLVGRAGQLSRRDLAALLLPLGVSALLAALAGRETARPFLFGALSLAMVLAGGLLALPQFRTLVPRLAVVGLAALAAASAILSFPDYLGYFNSVAGGNVGGPRLVADGNVDVGQDLARLGDFCRRRGIRTIGLITGPTVLDPALYGIPARRVEPMEAVNPGDGYYAVSARAMHADENWPGRPTRLDWYDEFMPVEQVGETIFVYRFHTFIRGRSRPPADFDGELMSPRQQRDRSNKLLVQYGKDHPNNGWIQGRVGRVHALQENSHQAIEALDRALADPNPALDADRAGWEEVAAWQALTIGRLDTAFKHFTGILEHRPERGIWIRPVLQHIERIRAALPASFADPTGQQSLLAELTWLTRSIGRLQRGTIRRLPTLPAARAQALDELARFCRTRSIRWIAMHVRPGAHNPNRFGVPVRAMQPEEVLTPEGWYAVDRADRGRADLWSACAVVMDWDTRHPPVATLGDTLDVYRFTRRADDEAAPADEVGVSRTAERERADATATLKASLARTPNDAWCCAELFDRTGDVNLLARAVQADRKTHAVYRPRWLTMGARDMIRAGKFTSAEKFLLEIRVGGRILRPWLDEVQTTTRWLQGHVAGGGNLEAPAAAKRVREAAGKLTECLDGAHFLPDRARHLAEAGAIELAAELARFAWQKLDWRSTAGEAGAWSLAAWRVDDAVPLLEAAQAPKMPRRRIYLCQALTFRGYLRGNREDIERAQQIHRDLIRDGVRPSNEEFARFVRRVRWVTDELRITAGLEKVE